MSLLIHLPLTKDLRNQGLANLPAPSWNSSSKDSGGKLGQYCYSDNIIYHTEDEWLGNNWSLACWVKSSHWGTYNDIILCKNTDNSSEAQFYFSIIGGSQLNIGSNASSQTMVISYTFLTNTWYHVVATYDGTILKLYLNGTEIGSKNYISTQKTGMNNLGIGCRSSNVAGTVGTGGGSKHLNDVRIYDHCLSPMEVKQISQGLILHYPLDNNGIGGENLLLNTSFQSQYVQSTGWDTSKNGTHLANNWGGYNAGVNNASAVYHAHLKEVDGEWVYEYIRTANESWLGISQGGLNSKLTAGKTYTFSWEEYRVEGNNYSSGGLYYHKTGATSAGFHLGQFGGSSGNILGQWRKFSYTFTAPTDGDYSKSMVWYIYGVSGGNGKMYIRHPKLEEGTKPTPWCPNKNDALYSSMGMDDNIEYDTSGFGNNGTRVGEFSWSTDTPRYLVSTEFKDDSGQYIHTPYFPELKQNITMSCWAYQTVERSTESTVEYIMSQGRDSYYNGFSIRSVNGVVFLCLNTGDGNNVSSGINILNGWHHIVATYNGSKACIYIDGELKGSKDLTGDIDYSMASERFVIGKMSYSYTSNAHYFPFIGYIVDARVYASCLSPEDILSLYQASAYIDSHGNTFASSYVEG